MRRPEARFRRKPSEHHHCHAGRRASIATVAQGDRSIHGTIGPARCSRSWSYPIGNQKRAGLASGTLRPPPSFRDSGGTTTRLPPPGSGHSGSPSQRAIAGVCGRSDCCPRASQQVTASRPARSVRWPVRASWSEVLGRLPTPYRRRIRSPAHVRWRCRGLFRGQPCMWYHDLSGAGMGSADGTRRHTSGAGDQP